MKIIKYITILIFGLLLCLLIRGEERQRTLPLEKLTDPSSQFFLPHPYPKTKEEIIVDLSYGINDSIAKIKSFTQSSIENQPEKFSTARKGKKKSIDYLSSILDIVEGKSNDYKIGEIIKVKNRMANISHEYSWLIIITDKNKKIIERINMDATGRVEGSASIKTGYFTEFLVTEKDVLHILASAINIPISDIKIKKMERIAFHSPIAPRSAPMWEITLANDVAYYYSIITDNVYKIDRRIPREKDKSGNWKPSKEFVSHDHFVVDTISDEILVFKIL